MVLFGTSLEYEQEVFCLIESRMAHYDAVVDIGANVGVYTIFFAKLFETLNKPAHVFAFEPSRKAFLRLIQNIGANSAPKVHIFNCAVAQQSGFSQFYEPQDHLTNGSLYTAFAEMFSPNVAVNAVMTISGEKVSSLVDSYQRVLLKIDVEGAESVVLGSMAEFILSKKPDIVLEVLPTQEDALNGLDFLLDNYRLFNITDQGLIEHEALVAGRFRDYLLVPQE